MSRTIVIWMLFLENVARGEDPSEGKPTLLNTTHKINEILKAISIEAPTLDPEEDPWMQIDDWIEFVLLPFSSTSTSKERMLDAICQSEDEGSEAFKIPSYPNTISFLEETRQTTGEDIPWIMNVDSIGSGETMSPQMCHQLVLPIPSNQKEQTRQGQCSEASVLCTRRRKWDLTPLARVMYKLTREAARKTEVNIQKWAGITDVPAPDFSSLLDGIETNVWRKDEELLLISMATQLLTDWSTTSALDHLTAQVVAMVNRLRLIERNMPKPLTKEEQPTTLPPDSEDQPPFEESTLLGHLDWEPRIAQLESKWAQFLLINNETYRKMENLLETSGFREDNLEASGLSENSETADEPIGMGIWRSLCNSLTRSIDLTLVRKRRSQTNESDSSAPVGDHFPLGKKITAKITQLYDQVSKEFYTPMEECAPCWTLILAISGLIALTSIHSVVLCVICVKLRTKKRNIKEVMETEDVKEENQGKGQKIAASKLGKAKAKRRQRSMTYNLVPTGEP